MSPVPADAMSARLAFAAVLAASLCLPARALDNAGVLATAASPAAAKASRKPLNLEISAGSYPRFDSVDGSNRNDRIDMTTWLSGASPSGVGISMGLSGAAGAQPGLGLNPNTGTANTQSLDLGLQWRYTLDNNYRINVAAWRQVNPPDALSMIQSRQPAYGARVEMQLNNVRRSGFAADSGFIGLQFNGGDTRIQLRRKDGKPAIYLRSKF